MSASASAGPLEGLPDLERLSRYDAALRQEPADRPALDCAAHEATARLAAAAQAGDRPAELTLLGYLGNALRILGRTDEAADLLGRAVTLARRLEDGRAEVANLIRQGEAIRYGGDLPGAERLYRAVLTRVLAAPNGPPQGLGRYEDFALQHLGKCRLEQGDAAEAIACFERALAIRRLKGDASLIASTEAALRLARETAVSHLAEPSRLVGTGPDVGVVDQETEEAPDEEGPEPPGRRLPA
jgi:HTH-type transcriptional regulator, pleiotropic regulator of extracellular virulence genes